MFCMDLGLLVLVHAIYPSLVLVMYLFPENASFLPGQNLIFLLVILIL